MNINKQKQNVNGDYTFQDLPNDVKESITKVNPEGVDLYEIELNNNNKLTSIPNINSQEIQQTFSQNRSETKYKGAIQLGKQKERIELKRILQNPNVLRLLNASGRGVINMSDIDSIDYIPNSRLAYFNKLIKIGLREGLSSCDADVVSSVWMSAENKEKLFKILNNLVRPNLNNYTLIPSNKSGIKYKCVGGKSLPDFYNPGTVSVPSMYDVEGGDSCGCNSQQTAGELAKTYNHVNELMNRYVAEMHFQDDDKILSEFFEPDVLSLLHWSRDMATSGKVDFQKLTKLTAALHNQRTFMESSYMLSLTKPFEYNQEVRVPSGIPVPTAAFSVQRNINLITNALGNVSFVICPFYLGTANTACAINNDASLNGTGASNFFTGIDLGQTLPSAFYTRYRLVSASVRVMFTSSSLNSTGFSTMSVDFDQCSTVAAGTINANFAKYASFSSTENGYYKQTKSVSNGNVMHVNFLPIDSSYTDFYNINNLPNGYIINGYVTGAPANSTIARLDVVFNYEAFVSQVFTDYIPSSANNNAENIDECKIFVNTCQSKRVNTPDEMYNLLPSTHQYNDKKINIPKEPVQVIVPVATDSIIDKIKNFGAEVLNVIVDDKVRDKNFSQKVEIVDKIKDLISPTINTYNYDKFDKKYNTDAFGNSSYNKIASGVGGALSGGLLSSILGIGTKLLPLI